MSLAFLLNCPFSYLTQYFDNKMHAATIVLALPETPYNAEAKLAAVKQSVSLYTPMLYSIVDRFEPYFSLGRVWSIANHRIGEDDRVAKGNKSHFGVWLDPL